MVRLYQIPQHLPLKLRLSASLRLLECPKFCGGVFGMLDQFPPQVTGFQVEPGVQAVDHPHLVSSPARSYVVPLLKAIVLAERQRPTFRNVDHRQKHHITLVALEVRRIAANNPTPLKLGDGQALPEQPLYFQSLSFPYKGDHSKGLVSVLRLLYDSGDDRHNCPGYVVVDVSVV